jgi:UDP-N-acetyl-D-mannosaminuronic acid dehydrogenase
MLKAHHVLWTDPFVDDAGKSPLETVVEESDVLFIATPHRAYRNLLIPPDKIVVDVWNCLPTRSTAEIAR